VKKKRLQKKTCFALGLAGAVMLLAGGVLVAASFGPANFLQMACFAFNGIMLLFLALMERGEDGRKKRVKLLLLFLALMIAQLRLPPLDWLEALVLPLGLWMYAKKGDGPFLWGLAAAEVAVAALRTLALTPLLGAHPSRWVGGGMVVLALVRALVLLRFYRAAALEKPIEDEAAIHRLR
jgi:hypothetical protein